MSVPRLQHDYTEEWIDVGLNAGAQGGAIYTAGYGDSTYLTEIGDLVRDEQGFRFSGMHGEFLELHGVVGRGIRWSGNLRVAASALAAIRLQRDNARMTEGTFTFIDEDDTEYANCSLRRFEIGRKQRIQGSGTLVWLVPYQIVLQQQEP